MLKDVKKMIQEELPKGEASEAPDEQSQEASEMSEDMELLTRLCDEHRITPNKELPPMRFLFTFNGTPCMPICELVAGTGKAKSGKTLFMSMIMACALDGEQLALKRIDSEPLTVLWFDTEQSEQSTQDILVNRIMPMAGITIRCQKEEAGGLTEEAVAYIDKDGKEFPFDDKFYVLNVRGIGWEKRKELLTFAIQRYQPDLVILDGMKDLMLDINDATQASVTTEDLMLCSQLNKCCIVNVLHQNKSEADRNMRGSIGTELSNKAFEAFECEVIGGKDDDEDGEETFVVKHAMSRKKRARRRLYYRLNDDNLPEQCSKPDTQTRKTKQGAGPKDAGTVAIAPEVKWEAFNHDYLIFHEKNGKAGKCPWEWNLAKLFREAFENHTQRPYGQVMGAALRLSKIQDKNYYYERYKEACRAGIIVEFKHPEKGDTWVELKTEGLPF